MGVLHEPGANSYKKYILDFNEIPRTDLHAYTRVDTQETAVYCEFASEAVRESKMFNAAVVIPTEMLNGFSLATRTEVWSALGMKNLETGIVVPVQAAINTSGSDDEGPPDLTPTMARKLIDPINPRSKEILRIIAQSETNVFRLKDVVAGVPNTKSYSDLRANWAGITRKVRKILDDQLADLIWWDASGIVDEDDNYVDHVGRVSDMTHKSLRIAFGL